TEICDVIHWMRLCRELFCLTGEISYMEALEKAFLNAFLAGVYEDGRNGAFFVRSSGRHWAAEPQTETKYQHCCVNNVARGFASAAESIIMEGEDGFYINQYIQSRIRFGEVSFRIGAGYVDRGEAAVSVRGIKEGKKLYLRIPAWSKKTIVRVIGDRTYETTECGSWFSLEHIKDGQVIRMKFDMTPHILDFSGVLQKDLPQEDYHIRRWMDPNDGLCNRELMVKQPMSIIQRGPVILARSKRIGSREEEMFGQKSVWGKKCSVSAQMLRHDRLLTLCRVAIQEPQGTDTMLMCDYASAANRDVEDARYFTIFV
ncbi:MAG: glycoside hydrolase family 127 protein, partial [Fusicatenibacter sp.]|nr:glycoside hydrolase family 127 protein [Lachnospiraceae bacterium]MDY2937634.1 glycoside hydrolase family 127 protein [Fusicatenibacter sp.]